jgi:hypothetical protein
MSTAARVYALVWLCVVAVGVAVASGRPPAPAGRDTARALARALPAPRGPRSASRRPTWNAPEFPR